MSDPQYHTLNHSTGVQLTEVWTDGKIVHGDCTIEVEKITASHSGNMWIWQAAGEMTNYEGVAWKFRGRWLVVCTGIDTAWVLSAGLDDLEEQLRVKSNVLAQAVANPELKQDRGPVNQRTALAIAGILTFIREMRQAREARDAD